MLASLFFMTTEEISASALSIPIILENAETGAVLEDLPTLSARN